MKTAVDESTSFLEPLNQKVEALEARLSVLEDRVAAIGQSPPRPASPATAPPTLLQALDLPPLPRLSAVLAAGGKVFLGIAGAYLLRAVAESGLVPQMIAVAVALAYAARYTGAHGHCEHTSLQQWFECNCVRAGLHGGDIDAQMRSPYCPPQPPMQRV